MTSLERLLSVAGPGLTDRDLLAPGLPAELRSLVTQRNGFGAFESALLVLPTTRLDAVPSIMEWNRKEGWRRAYRAVDQKTVFFALDIFCCHFGLSDQGVTVLDPEIGEVTDHSTSLEEWASKLLSDYDRQTGWSVAHEWQLVNGPLQLGHRLLPIKPFVLGGAGEVANLVSVPCEAATLKLASLHEQMRDVPDGRSITIKGWL